VLNLRLKPITYCDPKDDPLGRPCYGWAEGMPDELAFELNRGAWDIDAERPVREQFVTFSFEGIIRMAVEVHSVNEIPRSYRKALQGAVLEAGHPVYDTYVGHPTPKTASGHTLGYFTPKVLCTKGKKDDEEPCPEYARWILSGYDDSDSPPAASCSFHAPSVISGIGRHSFVTVSPLAEG
jgi:hypothetical protein